MFAILVVLASIANAAGPADLASLHKDQKFADSFRVEQLYLDPAGVPKGARFVHERGAVVDILFFDSVPQLSIAVRTLPDDERAAPSPVGDARSVMRGVAGGQS